MPKETLYAVAIGRQPGIYSDINEAKAQTRQVPKGRYKKFNSRDSAEQFLEKAGVLPPKERFYAVANGRKTGLFTNSAEANEQIHSFPHFSMRKFFSRQEAEDFLKEHGLSAEIKECDESNPLFKKTLEKAAGTIAKELRKLYESLEIDDDSSESEDFGEYLAGLNAYMDEDSSLDIGPLTSVYNHNVPADLQCDICTYNRQKALGLIDSDEEEEYHNGLMEYCTETGGYHCACQANCPRIIDYGMDIDLSDLQL